jgi:hypothetical protein
MSAQYIYKLTYPNGKIYIGQDETGSYATYFGEWDKERGERIEKEHPLEQTKVFTIRKDILWSSETAFPSKPIPTEELTQKKNKFIEKFDASNPEKGYNLIPKYDKE